MKTKEWTQRNRTKTKLDIRKKTINTVKRSYHKTGHALSVRLLITKLIFTVQTVCKHSIITTTSTHTCSSKKMSLTGRFTNATRKEKTVVTAAAQLIQEVMKTSPTSMRVRFTTKNSHNQVLNGWMHFWMAELSLLFIFGINYLFSLRIDSKNLADFELNLFPLFKFTFYLLIRPLFLNILNLFTILK